MPQLSTKLDWELANPKWAATLNPILALPILSGNKIDNIVLLQGVPKVVNHLLQRMPQGFILLDNTSNSSIWRTAPFNDLTMTLESTFDNTISIWVF